MTEEKFAKSERYRIEQKTFPPKKMIDLVVCTGCSLTY